MLIVYKNNFRNVASRVMLNGGKLRHYRELGIRDNKTGYPHYQRDDSEEKVHQSCSTGIRL